jgi:hypothetical protein
MSFQMREEDRLERERAQRRGERERFDGGLHFSLEVGLV